LYTVASESQIFLKRVFYLKQTNFIMGGPLAAGGPGQLPRFPPLTGPACTSKRGRVLGGSHT